MSTEQRLSLSLDSLIQQQRKDQRRGRGSSTARRKSGGSTQQHRGRHVHARGRGGGKSFASMPSKGMVRKRQGKGGKKVDPSSLSFTVRVDAHREPNVSEEDRQERKGKLEGNDRWDHGGFHSMERLEHGDPKEPSRHGTKLFISNLHEKVSTVDIRDLFRPVGPLVAYQVHYDSNNTSQGTAHVIFEKREHAEEGLEKYNGVLLDDMPMNIELIKKRPALSGKLTGRPGNITRTGAGASTVAFQKALAGATCME
mmetsp:Transcript_9455/g.18797  ORF Transcript_9455/g.18797 Transcript_9455/m.18797 type:complete len:255 (-) Transcript_9455:2445-3209(-)